MNRYFIIPLLVSAACDADAVFLPSSEQIQQAIREIPFSDLGDFGPGQMTAAGRTVYRSIVHNGVEVCVYGCDPFPRVSFYLYEPADSLPQSPSNEAIQLTASRRAFSLLDDDISLGDFDARFWWP